MRGEGGRYYEARMTDEPIPPPIEVGTSEWSEPPTPGQEPIESFPQRNPIGWVVSGVILLLLIVMAVGMYLSPPEGERSQVALQESLRYNVSLDASSVPSLKEKIAESRTEGLKSVLRDATEEARDSEEAARIAVVAARELKKDPPKVALDKLAKSKDKLSVAMGEIYGDQDAEVEDVYRFLGLESNKSAINDEFAVNLAKAQAKEMIGEPGNRESIVDKGMLGKFLLVAFGGTGVLLAGVLCLIAFFALRAAGKIEAVGVLNMDKSDGDRYMCRFAVYIIAFLTVGYVGDRLFELPFLAGVNEIWSQVITMFAAFAVVVVLLRVPIMDRRDSYGVVVGERQPFWKLVRAGVFGYLCTVPLLVAALALIAGLSKYLPEPTHPITQEMAAASGFDWLAIVLTAAVLAPLLEELGFRGLLFPALTTQIRKPWVAMVACGLLFAAIHPQGPLAWPALATTGAAAAALRYYTGSLVPSITLHVVHNALILAIGTMVG